jgi:lipopolysaccharide transport system permease protein
MSIYKYRFLILELIKIEITQNYKRSFIGISWIILLPLMQSLIWIFLQMNGIFNPGIVQSDYVTYVLIGTMLWQMYNFSFDTLGNSISTSIKPLIQGYIPVYTILISKFAMVLARFVVALLINIIIIKVVTGIELNVIGFLICTIPLMLFCLSIGMIVSMVEVVNEDIYTMGKEFNKVLLFLTPIIYAPNIDSKFIQTITSFNPLTYFICVPRSVLSYTTSVPMSHFYMYTLGGVILFLLSSIVYSKRSRIVIEKLIE